MRFSASATEWRNRRASKQTAERSTMVPTPQGNISPTLYSTRPERYSPALRQCVPQMAGLGRIRYMSAAGQALPFAPSLFGLHAWSVVCRIPDPTRKATPRLKKLAADENELLKLLERWRGEA